jgi:hypothetical protein
MIHMTNWTKRWVGGQGRGQQGMHMPRPLVAGNDKHHHPSPVPYAGPL